MLSFFKKKSLNKDWQTKAVERKREIEKLKKRNKELEENREKIKNKLKKRDNEIEYLRNELKKN